MFACVAMSASVNVLIKTLDICHVGFGWAAVSWEWAPRKDATLVISLWSLVFTVRGDVDVELKFPAGLTCKQQSWSNHILLLCVLEI